MDLGVFWVRLWVGCGGGAVIRNEKVTLFVLLKEFQNCLLQSTIFCLLYIH